MILGRRFWILVWYGILALGLLGLWASVYWARRTHWKNLDELLRAAGTAVVSVGMLLLLHDVATALAPPLLFIALAAFIAAIVAGRRQHPERRRPSGGIRVAELPPEQPPDAQDAEPSSAPAHSGSHERP